MHTQKKQRGRPKGSTSSNPANARLPHIRVTPQQLENYKAAAKRQSKTLSAWVKEILDRASRN